PSPRETGKRVINIQHSFNGAVTRAGLKDVHFHDLRRSFVTRKVTEGWDRDHVKAITGHRTDKVFARYNKPSLETLRAVVEGTFNSSCVTPVSHGPGLASRAVLSARNDYMEEDGARWPHRSSKRNTGSERK